MYTLCCFCSNLGRALNHTIYTNWKFGTRIQIYIILVAQVPNKGNELVNGACNSTFIAFSFKG